MENCPSNVITKCISEIDFDGNLNNKGKVVINNQNICKGLSKDIINEKKSSSTNSGTSNTINNTTNNTNKKWYNNIIKNKTDVHIIYFIIAFIFVGIVVLLIEKKMKNSNN